MTGSRETRRGTPAAQDSFEARFERGNRLSAEGRFREASAEYRKATELDPANASAWYNLGIAFDELLEVAESETAYRTALQLAPELAEARVNLALCLLKQGRLSEAWPEYEWRWHASHPRGNSSRLASLSKPRWTGQDLAGKTLLLAPEQGLGDTIQFARFATPLAAKGARTVIAAHPSLVPLLRGARDVARVIALGEPFRSEEYDYWSLPLSLPAVLGTTPESIPAEVPYVHAESDKVVAWSARLSHLPGKLRVGLVWSGNARHPNDARRSVPPATFARILDVPDVDFVSVQEGASRTAVSALRERGRLFDAGEYLCDFAETAALMECLDLLITVDSSPAHLAGALARPTWILLPFNPDWRWMLGRTDSPWYPGVRLFRQPAPRDWTSVLRDVVEALASFRPMRPRRRAQARW